jgi:hypothetical protein
MAMEITEEVKNFLFKMSGYAIGVMAGLAAKLVDVSKKRKLTTKEFITHSFIAFACAILVWNLLSYYKRLEVANVVSVIVGRYGDLIILAIWNKIKDFIGTKKIDEI